MNKSKIIKAIEKTVIKYPVWTIGITDDLERSKSEHGNPTIWHDWKADNEIIARNVKKHFLVMGMKGGGGDGGHPNFVYIF